MISKLIGISALAGYFYFTPILLKLIWPKDVNTNDQGFYLLSLALVHAGLYFIVNSFYYLLYHFEIQFFEQFRTEKAPWPWYQDKEKWRITLRKTVSNFLLNFVVTFVLAYLESLRKITKRLDYDSFPRYTEILWQIAFSGVLEDFGFYWVHRIFHIPLLYRYIHKKHHEYNITISVSAEYAHPIEFVLGNSIPVLLGPKILGLSMHQSTLVIWIGLRIIKTLSAHSGYSFPWDPINLIPLGTPPEFHSLHHSQNQGNYGSIFQFWDILFGTDQSYKDFLKTKELKKK